MTPTITLPGLLVTDLLALELVAEALTLALPIGAPALATDLLAVERVTDALAVDLVTDLPALAAKAEALGLEPATGPPALEATL